MNRTNPPICKYYECLLCSGLMVSTTNRIVLLLCLPPQLGINLQHWTSHWSPLICSDCSHWRTPHWSPPASLVRHSLLHFHLSDMAVHHLHRLHYHRLHLLLLAQYFILNSRLVSSANPFLHRPFPCPTGLIPRTLGPPNVFTAAVFVCMVC